MIGNLLIIYQQKMIKKGLQKRESSKESKWCPKEIPIANQKESRIESPKENPKESPYDSLIDSPIICPQYNLKEIAVTKKEIYVEQMEERLLMLLAIRNPFTFEFKVSQTILKYRNQKSYSIIQEEMIFMLGKIIILVYVKSRINNELYVITMFQILIVQFSLNLNDNEEKIDQQRIRSVFTFGKQFKWD
ncbi:hypothetical protein pb186bvf_000730 [Paramecium bursaria]